jgi:transposase InsO family protein
LLRRLTASVPYKIHTVLTDHGTHFTDPRGQTGSPSEIKELMRRGELFRAHAFEYACALLDIDHRLTKPRHPWTNGQIERMNPTLKEATVSRYFYETHEQLSAHLDDFVTAYNFGCRLKALRGLTPYEFICKCRTIEPERFIPDPLHQMPGLNI